MPSIIDNNLENEQSTVVEVDLHSLKHVQTYEVGKIFELAVVKNN